MQATQNSLEIALRLQKLELEMAELKADLTKNTTATENLLKAWNGSQSTVSFIKGCAVFGAAVVAIWGGVTKIWGT